MISKDAFARLIDELAELGFYSYVLPGLVEAVKRKSLAKRDLFPSQYHIDSVSSPPRPLYNIVDPVPDLTERAYDADAENLTEQGPLLFVMEMGSILSHLDLIEVGSVAEAAGYTITGTGDTLQITVPIGTLRKQLVSVEFGQTDKSGHSMVNYWSICGPVTEKNALSLLRYNTQMLHGAFAVRKVGTAEVVVIQANQLAETLDPLEVSRVLSAVAWQADQVEQKLVGRDEY